MAFASGCFSGDRDEPSNVSAARPESIVDLRVGDCLAETPEEGIAYVARVVPCSHPHVAEVYAVYDMADGDYPGDGAVSADAEEGCGLALTSEITVGFDDVAMFEFHPTQLSWDNGSRGVTCVALLNGPQTGSLVRK